MSRWAIEVVKPQTALERFQTYRVSGLEAGKESFFMANPYGELENRSLATGGPIWSAKLEAVSQSSWTLDGEHIYGGDTKGNVYAIQVSDGKILWKASTKGVFFSKPLVRDSSIFMMNSLGTIQSYDKRTGAWQWQQTDPSIASVSLWSSQGPLTFGKDLIAGFPSALLQGMDPATGQILWKESFSSLPSGSDSINDVKAISGSSHLLIASSFGGDLKVWSLKGKIRKPSWQKNLSLYAPPTISDDGIAYIVTKDGNIEALDAETGYSKWKKQLPSGLGTSVVISEDKLWVATSEGQLLVYTIAGDLLASTHSFESPIWNPPLMAGASEAIVLTSQGILRKFRLASY